jgi:hypothetical protein
VSKRLGVTRVAHVPLELFRKSLHRGDVAVWRCRAVRCRATSLLWTSPHCHWRWQRPCEAPLCDASTETLTYQSLVYCVALRCNKLPNYPEIISRRTQNGSPRPSGRAFKNGEHDSPVRSICLKVRRLRKLDVQVFYQRCPSLRLLHASQHPSLPGRLPNGREKMDL